MALIFGGLGQVQASPVTSLFNTGVDASGIPLPNGSIGDPHYNLVSVPGGTTNTLVCSSSATCPSSYLGPNSSSAWIGPNKNGLWGPEGLYDYKTTFNLSGFDPSTTKIIGKWSSDNNGVSILLNGVNTGNPATNFEQFKLSFAPFSINSGFQSGINTIEFIVNNGHLTGYTENATALRVEMTGTATVVPVPAAIWLFSSALAGLIGLATRRK